MVLKDATGTSVKISLLDVERELELKDELFIVDPFFLKKIKINNLLFFYKRSDKKPKYAYIVFIFNPNS